MIDDFVDMDTGVCYFTDDDFIMILEFAATFGNDPNHPWHDTVPGLQEGRYLLDNTYVRGLHDIQFMEYYFAGEAFQYIGYPASSGSGIGIDPGGDALGISARSQNPKGAFAFINYLLSDRYQIDVRSRWSTPMKHSAIEALIIEQTTPQYYIDDNGQELEWRGDVMSFSGSSDIVMSDNSRNHLFVDTFRDLLRRADRLDYWEPSISQIINEEAAPFFEGQKTAAEVAEIIQRRVQVYVDENR
jgi:ABC-type glycerol-3-phosphate transport system substrate-binding protein